MLIMHRMASPMPRITEQDMPGSDDSLKRSNTLLGTVNATGPGQRDALLATDGMTRLRGATRLSASLIGVAATALWALTGAAQAASVFQGRLADGTASSTCTVTGSTKCTSFYDTDLDITILNNWNIGTGNWSATAAAGSAQALAESAGFAATGLTGWVLPTGDYHSPGGQLNQFLSIWDDLGGTTAALQSRFDGVQIYNYWTSSKDPVEYGP